MRVCKYCKQEWKNGQIQCPSCGSKSYWDIEETEELNRPNNFTPNTTKEIKDKVKTNRIILGLCIVVLVVIAFVIGNRIKASVEHKKALESQMTANYEQGLAYIENGNYASAIKKLRNIDESYELYSEVSSLLLEVEGTYKNTILNEVDLLLEQENFDEAYSKMEVLKDLFSDDANILVKSQNIHKQAILKNVDELMGEEKYEEIISLIDSSDTELKDDSEVRLKYDEAKMAYINIIKEHAEEEYNSRGISEAISVIDDGLSVLPENVELLNLIEEYNEKIPVDLFAMAPFVGEVEGNLYSAEGEADNMGNMDYTYHVIIPDYADDITWIINKEYVKLEFRVGLNQKDSDTSHYGWIALYDGNRKIMQTENITAGVRPQSYTVDVTGVDELRVEFGGSTYYGYSSASLLLSEFWISK